jgi:hypothetical protein
MFATQSAPQTELGPHDRQRFTPSMQVILPRRQRVRRVVQRSASPTTFIYYQGDGSLITALLGSLFRRSALGRVLRRLL